MREISRFYGIVIEMEEGDTPPAHFHASYGGAVALIGIEKSTVFKGRLPPRGSPGRGWSSLRRKGLRQAWRRASNAEDLGRRAARMSVF